MESKAPGSSPLLHWEAMAAAWDEGMGDEGNQYFSALELPVLKRLVNIRPEARGLDLATGNGLVARWLAQEGASVLATDGSEAMLERARARTALWYERGQLPQGKIAFDILDVTDNESWKKMISSHPDMNKGFDVITMNMALMDIPDLEPLAAGLPKILRKNGCFVATLLHPIFFTSGADRQLTVHENPRTGEREFDLAIVMRKYFDVPPARQLPFTENTESPPPFSFHRPLQELFAPFFKNGLVLDALEETNFDETFQDSGRPHAARNFTQFPKILAFRMRQANLNE
ncbi:S-adenosyl-L-methionine-dependent methyltransferase [Penicillium waksmanii]|uniref:S-adenosyl-L-methionine-dependent methyltransferase n=1 Tax=Penicillium waksmanii TaxID=69791 RepID=UPI002548AA3C|nr:S-adenosyl-L-methionine-dependent methyltransferase [Penicillium waksmanii]KAJ5980356.1 S-adenosyl-L-methionine-dependent methyltransferase [Penicillium waksmanii]